MTRAVLMFCVLLAPHVALAGNVHGQREYRQTGYYEWNQYKCQWVWYPYPKGASVDSHAVTNTTTYNISYQVRDYQPAAIRGQSGYLVQDSAYVYGTPFDPNKAFHLASELQQLTQKTAADGYSALTAFGYQAHQNQLDLEKERTQAAKIQALAAVAEATKSQPSGSYVRQQLSAVIGAAVEPQAVVGADQVFAARCAGCHSPETAQAKGGGTAIDLNSLSPESKRLVLGRIVTHDPSKRMPRGGSLTDAEMASFLEFLK